MPALWATRGPFAGSPVPEAEMLTILILAVVAWLFLVLYGLYERGTKR